MISHHQGILCKYPVIVLWLDHDVLSVTFYLYRECLLFYFKIFILRKQFSNIKLVFRPYFWENSNYYLSDWSQINGCNSFKNFYGEVCPEFWLRGRTFKIVHIQIPEGSLFWFLTQVFVFIALSALETRTEYSSSNFAVTLNGYINGLF